MDDAKTNMSKLVARAAARREGFVIAGGEQADRPMRRIGFMKSRIKVADNWKEIGREEIDVMCEGGA